MKFILLLFFCFAGAFAKAQTLRGTVYDATTTVADVSIQNLTQNVQTYSNDDGTFTINAAAQDSIAIYLFPYAAQIKQISTLDLEDPIVIELKEETNQLDEVLLRKVTKPQAFEAVVYEKRLKRAILDDYEKNPLQYQPPPHLNIDFILIFKKIANLFKKKKKQPSALISSEDLEYLFTSNDLFTDRFLTEDLKIPLDQKFYFFDFCELKSIDRALLREDQAFLLIDRLITITSSYNSITRSIED